MRKIVTACVLIFMLFALTGCGTANKTGNEASCYPEQAAKYLKMGLDGSALLSFNKAGEHRELLFPRVNYSDAQMSPDGNHLLCKTNSGGAGESRWCGYSVVSLITNPAEIYDYNGIQWGYQDHVWLDDNLIGFADSDVIGGQEDTWKSIQLFDSRYTPINTSLQLSTNKDDTVVGIGYNRTKKQYILTHAINKSLGADPFAANQLILSVFNSQGILVHEIPIPKEYQSPYSRNILALYSNNPMVTEDGHILLTAQKAGGNRDLLLLVLSPKDQSIQELPYGDALCLSADGKTAFAVASDYESNRRQSALLHFDGRESATVQELPHNFVDKNYSGEFVPFEAAISAHHVYIMAENYMDAGEAYCGLFYWDINENQSSEQIKLLQVFPDRDFCNIVGVDGEGFCSILINGVVPDYAEEGLCCYILSKSPKRCNT